MTQRFLYFTGPKKTGNLDVLSILRDGDILQLMKLNLVGVKTALKIYQYRVLGGRMKKV